MTDPAATLDLIAQIDASAIKDELKRLRAIEEWARAQIGYAIGDRVELAHDIDCGTSNANGWYTYQECLTKGAAATVVGIEFNQFRSRWNIIVKLDQEWSASNWGSDQRPNIQRFWNGPPEKMPADFIDSSVTQRGDHRHVWHFWPSALLKATP